jgi:hypothetical protein
MSKQHRPTRQDKVNDQQRFSEGKQANGFIHRLIYGDDGLETIMVRFDDGIENYDAEQFHYRWTDRLGGVWQLPKRRGG